MEFFPFMTSIFGNISITANELYSDTISLYRLMYPVFVINKKRLAVQLLHLSVCVIRMLDVKMHFNFMCNKYWN